MAFRFQNLSFDRYLVWDLMRETDPYYLNHHLFETDFSLIHEECLIQERQTGILPSYLSYLLSAYAKTIFEFPEFNSYLRLWPTTKLAIYEGVDISFTIEREWRNRKIVLLALLTDAQLLSPPKINEFLLKRKTAPLESLEEFQGLKRLMKIPNFFRWYLLQILVKPFPEMMRKMFGTAAFTSVGKLGTTFTTPLAPKTCTLSLGQICLRPKVMPDGTIAPRMMGWLTVTYDHRVIDGAEVARFGNSLRARIENWQAVEKDNIFHSEKFPDKM